MSSRSDEKIATSFIANVGLSNLYPVRIVDRSAHPPSADRWLIGGTDEKRLRNVH